MAPAQAADDPPAHPTVARVPPRLDAVFQGLPPLTSAEYLALLKTEAGSSLPAEVLARAYRQLPADAPAARATLEVLFGPAGGPTLLSASRRHITNHDYFTAEDLAQDAASLLLGVLGTPRGTYAEVNWAVFCHPYVIDALRELVGRDGVRRLLLAPDLLEQADDTNSVVPPGDRPDAVYSSWIGSLEPDLEEWLTDFMDRAIARIPDAEVRAVAEDQWGSRGARSPLSGKGGPGQQPLTKILGCGRTKVHELQDDGRVLLHEALRSQTERVLDGAVLERFERHRRGRPRRA